MENFEKKELEFLEREKFMEVISKFSTRAKIELLQLVNGLRSVAEITVIPKFKDIMLPSIESLRDLGFAIVQKENEYGITEYFVSKDYQLAVEALNCEDHKRFGELMGFPESSIKAFLDNENNKDSLLEDEELAQRIGFENYCFPFRISREMAEDEILYLKKSYLMLLEQAPQLIDDMLPSDLDREEFKRKVSVFVYG
jgi:hypothetical protein